MTDHNREELIEKATWALIDYDTDVVDRGVRDEHYRERRADVERVWAVFEQAHTPTDDERMAAHKEAKRAEWEAEGEHVFIERYGAHRAKFGGIGGDATSLTITREAWKSMGEPDVLAVSWVPVEQTGESRAE